MVISAGVKSILDIGRTLEFLETQGVAVATLGPTRDFPSFFSRRSGFLAPHHVQDAAAAAVLLERHRTFGLGSGLLLAAPIPEAAAADGEAIEAEIRSAVAEAEQEGVQGNDVTPYVLARLNRATEGRSLAANLALVENNAEVGAEVAMELAAEVDLVSSEYKYLRTARPMHSVVKGTDNEEEEESAEPKRPLVVGGSIFDLVTRVTSPSIKMDGSTHQGNVDFSFGGVGRNMADALACFDANPYFLSAVGEDDLGESILSESNALCLSVKVVLKSLD